MLAVLLLIFWFSIRPTIKAYFLNKKYKQEIALAQIAPQEIIRYRNAIETANTNKASWEKEELFEVVSNFSDQNGLIIKSLGEPEITLNGEHRIATHKIIVQGSFLNITQLIYELEQVKRVGNVASATYEIQKDRLKKKTALIATIYLQHLSQEKSDNQ